MQALTPRRRAILVLYGVGQQQPFQVLDSVSQGLYRELTTRGEAPGITHLRLGRDGVFDQGTR